MTALLRLAFGACLYGRFGSFGKFGAVRQAVGARNAARTIVVIERLDPKMDRARIARYGMRLDYSRAEKLKVRGDWIDRRPAEQCSRAEKDDDEKSAR